MDSGSPRPPRQPFNLGEVLDDPVMGAQFDQPLRLIARYSVLVDVTAPRMQCVCQQFKYCWELALLTTETDVAALRRKRVSPEWGPLYVRLLKYYIDGTPNRCDLIRGLVRGRPSIKAQRDALRLAGAMRTYQARPVTVNMAASVDESTRVRFSGNVDLRFHQRAGWEHAHPEW